MITMPSVTSAFKLLLLRSEDPGGWWHMKYKSKIRGTEIFSKVSLNLD
jgi:hypothetical protein